MGFLYFIPIWLLVGFIVTLIFNCILVEHDVDALSKSGFIVGMLVWPILVLVMISD